MKRQDIKLGGVTVLAVTTQGWRFTTGVSPNQQVFLVHDDRWPSIEEKLGEEVDLDIGGRWKVQRLILVEEVPTTRKYHRGVLVADIRYWWQRKLVLRDYNIRRRQNAMRLLGASLVQLQSPVPKYAFLPYSTDDGEPFSAVWSEDEKKQGVIPNVLEELEPGNWKIDSVPTVTGKNITSEGGDSVSGRVTVNDVRVRDPGNQAMARALSLAPGADVWVDAEGTVRVFDTTDLAETPAFMEKVGGETWAGGITRTIDRSKIRPKAVYVYFEREIEMLARSQIEGASDDTTVPADQKERVEANVENVGPVPDPTLDDVKTGTQLVLGTWTPFEHLVPSWDADRAAQDGGADTLPYTFENIHRLWMESGMEAVWAGHGDLIASGSGARRVGCIRGHYRVTYRLEQAVMERMARVAAVRLAILDDITRTRAPATVWANYCIVQSNKGIFLASRKKDPLDCYEFMNVDAYPDLDQGESWLDKEAIASATLQLIDPELGVFRIHYNPDPYGRFAAIIPSYLAKEDDAGDTQAPAASVFRALRFASNQPIMLGGKVAGVEGMTMHAGHRVAFIFSGVAAAPNSKKRYERVVIRPQDVAQELQTEFNVEESTGPVWEILAPANLITSRWGLVPAEFSMETYVDALNQLLGLGGGPDDGSAGDTGGDAGTQGGAGDADGAGGEKTEETIEDPPKPWGLLNRGHLIGWAVAEAIKVYAGLADRLQGRPAVHLSTVPTDLRLAGGVKSLSYEAEPSGRYLARIDLAGPQFNLNPMALIPQWARPQILGVILDKAKP